MFLPESLRRLALRSAQRLRGIRGADHIQEVLYVELWMLPALFGQDGERLAAFYGWFRVSLVVSAVPGCGVLVFIIGSPLYQYVTKFLIVAMSFQLRIRRNRGPCSRIPHVLHGHVVPYSYHQDPYARGAFQRESKSEGETSRARGSERGLAPPVGHRSGAGSTALTDPRGLVQNQLCCALQDRKPKLKRSRVSSGEAKGSTEYHRKGWSTHCDQRTGERTRKTAEGSKRNRIKFLFAGNNQDNTDELYSSTRPPPPGHLALDLLRLGAHSQTFIQLEKGFAATGLMLVLLMASLESRQLGPRKPGPRLRGRGCRRGGIEKAQEMQTGRGLEPLQLVQSQLLTTRNLAAASAILLDPRGLFPSHQGGGSVSLRPSRPALPNVWLQTPSEFILSVKGS
uniref:Uncharacterized protein n=1 Tax=Rangifer tarandus platyrhynchus TaxID=3082113 RepID=A0ACB0EMP6_RANTA|nr:unnamed protein product [Rangifer tarandus platyrhynchus]